MTSHTPDHGPQDEVSRRASDQFNAMVQSVGVKRYASALGLSTRQVNRMLAGAQPNPVERLVRAVQASLPEAGDRALDAICQELGGYFIREEGTIDSQAVNAVRECAEAIAAISDGHISEVDEMQIREAISALVALSRAVQDRADAGGGGAEPGGVRVNVNPHPLNLASGRFEQTRTDRPTQR